MPIEILMPALSPTMTEGNLAKWHVKEGDHVAAGDILAEIETDKATMEIEAVEEGVLGRILVADGTEGVAVNAPIALMLEEGEDAAALDAAPAAPSPPPTAAAPAADAPTPAPQAAPAPAPSGEKGDPSDLLEHDKLFERHIRVHSIANAGDQTRCNNGQRACKRLALHHRPPSYIKSC